jgi:hypothetical protein
MPAANATGAVELSLPFTVSAAVEPPAGTVKAYACDMLFNTDQVRWVLLTQQLDSLDCSRVPAYKDVALSLLLHSLCYGTTPAAAAAASAVVVVMH